MDRAARSFRRIRPSHRRTRRLPPPDKPSRCMKYSLFFINVLFWIIGILILLIGSYIMVELKDVINSFSDLWYQPAIIFVVLGSLLFIITFFGCIGSLRENTCLLCFFSACLSITLILLLTGGVLAYLYRGPLEEAINDKLRNAIVFYRDSTKEDLQFLIDTAQTEIGCCGSRSYKDWELNIYFNCTSISLAERCGVPYSCCKKEIQSNRQCGYSVGKMSAAKRQEIIYTEGCLTKSIAWIKTNFYLLVGLSAALLILILVSTCMALSLRSQITAIKQYANKNSGNTSGVRTLTHTPIY